MELDQLAVQPLETLVCQEPCVAEFLASVGLNRVPFRGRVGDWLAALSDEDVSDAGMGKSRRVLDLSGYAISVLVAGLDAHGLKFSPWASVLL